MRGTTATTFSPSKKLTRAQAVSLLVRALDLEAVGTAPFKDIGSYAVETQEEIAAAYENGIIKGIDGNFMPTELITRAQFALMIERAFEQYTGEKVEVSTKAPFTDFGNYDKETVNAISVLYDLGIATGSEGKYMPNNSTTREQAAKIISNFIYNTKQMKKAE